MPYNEMYWPCALVGGVDLDKQPNFELMKYRQEWWKTAVSALTPIMIAALTFFITGALNDRESSLRRGEQLSSDKQKIYSQMAPDLNIIYVLCQILVILEIFLLIR
jgi:hypothetical protein